MPRKLDTDKLREFQEYQFTPEQIARYLKATPDEVRQALAALDAPSPAEVARQQRVEAAKTAAGLRPRPPDELFACDPDEEDFRPLFLPADDLTTWLYKTFLSSGAPIYRENCSHLLDADIGCLWTNVLNTSGRRRVLATAEMPKPSGSPWTSGRAEQQLWDWFDLIPTFVLTFDAQYAATCDNWAWLAVCLHELLHCGQKENRFGDPMYSMATGLPLFCMRKHDIEEFEDVMRLFGVKSTGRESFLKACLDGPTLAQATIDGACGTCSR